ncbi:MAG: Ig-like domain-containing protein [Tepidisphaerales bacterium]
MTQRLGGRGVREGLKSAVARMERLEDRRLLSTALLSSGFGPGALQVAVDPYGAFGLVPTERATQFTDFTVGSAGVVPRSYVYFSPVGQFLTSAFSPQIPVLQPSAEPLPEVEFLSATDRSAVSSFRLTGVSPGGEPFDYRVELLQGVSDVTPTPITGFFDNLSGFQTTLTQQYRITNLLGTAASFNITRYLETQGMGAARGWLDGGRTVLTGGGAFERHLLMRSFGGTLLGAGVGDAGLDAVIAEAGVLPPSRYGVAGGTDSPSDPESFIYSTAGGGSAALAQTSAFSVGPRQTVVFTTTTTFATGRLVQTFNQTASAAEYRPVAGDFAFNSFEVNYDFPQDGGSAQPLTLPLSRLGGTRGTANARVTLLPSSTTPLTAVTLSTPQPISFAEGQASATVTLTLNENLVGLEPSQLFVAVSSETVGAGVATPSVIAVNVLPRRPVFALSPSGSTAVTYSARQGDGTVPITVYRRGLPNGPAAVRVQTFVGSSSYADDVLVEFADGETEKVALVPIRTTDVGTTPLAVTVNLLSTTLPGGLPSAIAGTTGTLNVELRDTEPPTVTNLTPNVTRNRIASITLTFSEPMNNAGSVSNYGLFLRSGETGFGAARLRELPLASALYDPTTNAVTLIPRRPLSLNTSYQLTARSSEQLTDLAGNPLQQNPSGVANYVAVFSLGRTASYVDATGDLVRLRLSSGNLFQLRNAAGDSLRVQLFGDGRPDAVLTGSVVARRNTPGTTPLGLLINPSNVRIELPESFLV